MAANLLEFVARTAGKANIEKLKKTLDYRKFVESSVEHTKYHETVAKIFETAAKIHRRAEKKSLSNLGKLDRTTPQLKHQTELSFNVESIYKNKEKKLNKETGLFTGTKNKRGQEIAPIYLSFIFL